MKILLTGATGYIGKRLLPVLLQNKYEVVCCVRDKKRFKVSERDKDRITVVEVDLLQKESLESIPKDIKAAYYLVHSMSSESKNFEEYESKSAINFKDYLNTTHVEHLVYLSGITNDNNLSKHLASRKNVEDILTSGSYNYTTLRAGIIIGSGSASFEIIRDLVEKLPIMITPKWLNTLSQPVSIRDIILALEKTLLNPESYNQSFDVGGPDILTYKEMLLKFAEVRGLKRIIITLPVLTPKLSSYWLYFVTSTTFSLAVKLVDSMKVEVVCRDNKLFEMLNINPLSYSDSISAAFKKLDQNLIVSSWKDSLISGRFNSKLSHYIQVPVNGCYKDRKELTITDKSAVLKNIWAIGGSKGWYYANWLWGLRGFIDKLFGGVGLRRGRSSEVEINPGDAIDFWRVLLADKNEGRLLLYAEMKLPGEAWLEFNVSETVITQQATFRPKGLFGRLYWYLSYPFHVFIFKGMINNIATNYKT